jgi:hypothetical protein
MPNTFQVSGSAGIRPLPIMSSKISANTPWGERGKKINKQTHTITERKKEREREKKTRWSMRQDTSSLVRDV